MNAPAIGAAAATATLLVLGLGLSLGSQDKPNLLIVIMDDVGAEFLEFTPQGTEAIGEGSTLPTTPVMSAIADAGLIYTNVWSNPNCSPTRSSIVTGMYGHRTGIGAVVGPLSDPAESLDLSETTLADRLALRGYETGIFGKWHLSLTNTDPCDQGFDVFEGTQGNIDDYFSWPEIKDTKTAAAPTTSTETTYASTYVTDQAIAWIGAQSDGWFCIASYNAAHAPFHNPPGYSEVSDRAKYRASIEYLDAEIGRLLAACNSLTTYVIIGDNGTPDSVVHPPNTSGKSKGSVYRGGIEVPMLVGGHAVARSISKGDNSAGQLIAGQANVTDLYRTTLELLQGPTSVPADVNSVTLLSGGQWVATREWNFIERATPLGVAPGGPYDLLRRAVEEDGYKALYDELGGIELYNVAVDEWEETDLLLDGTSAEETAILAGFTARLAEIGL